MQKKKLSKFVTADSLDSEFGEVLIRVGTDLGGGGGGGAGRPVKVGNEGEEKIVIEERSTVDTLRAGFEKMIAEKKAEAEKTDEGGNEPQAPIVPLCYPSDQIKNLTLIRMFLWGMDVITLVFVLEFHTLNLFSIKWFQVD